MMVSMKDCVKSLGWRCSDFHSLPCGIPVIPIILNIQFSFLYTQTIIIFGAIKQAFFGREEVAEEPEQKSGTEKKECMQYMFCAGCGMKIKRDEIITTGNNTLFSLKTAIPEVNTYILSSYQYRFTF